MGRRLLSLPVLVAVLGIGTVPTSPIRAGARGPQAAEPQHKVRLFNIGSQPLIPALQAYSAVTGYQVACDSRLAAGRRSSPVVGLFTPETALRMMLDGTALTIRYTGPQDITLALEGSNGLADPAWGPGGAAAGTMVLDTLHVDVPVGAERREDYGNYGLLVRAAARRALAGDPATSHRAFDLQLDIEVTPDGLIRKARLVSSTGSARLDASIMRALTSADVGKVPPEGLPQPVRIAVVSI